MNSSKKNKVDTSAVFYRDVSVVDSLVNEHCIVGDFSRIYRSELMEYVKIDRNNFVMDSVIGRFTYTGNSTVIQAAKIGSFCSVSWGVSIGGGEHPLDRFTTHDFLYNDRYGFNTSEEIAENRYKDDCVLENDVWIGANSVVLRGVRIGTGAVIGAGSVVTKDVPSYAIYAGNPARLIRHRFAEDVIRRLLSSEWWKLDHTILKEHLGRLRDADIERFLEDVEGL